MISYRERQLLLVQKYLADKSEASLEYVSALLQGNGANQVFDYESYPEIDSYDELVNYVSSRGYDTYIRAEDILSEEEIKQLQNEYKDIEQQFAGITKLNKVDAMFVILATFLQILRQAFQPKIDFESLFKELRLDDKGAAKVVKEEAEKKAQEYKDKNMSGGSHRGNYYASNKDILDFAHVPYDSISGSKKFDIGLSGNNHRSKTLGHDPYLGYVFGTCNILTNTLTTSTFQTFHVKNRTIVAKGNTPLMFEHSFVRIEETKSMLVAALAKQFYHIQSDVKSKNGLDLPFLSLILDEKQLERLRECGIDYNLLETMKTAGKQAAFAEAINEIIAILHRIFMAYDEYKNDFEGQSQESIMETIKNYQIFASSDGTANDRNYREIRTKKIILISNSLASAANLTITGSKVIIETMGSKNYAAALHGLDVGGIMATVRHLITDVNFILKVKKSFIQSCLENDFAKELEELDYQINDDST